VPFAAYGDAGAVQRELGRQRVQTMLVTMNDRCPNCGARRPYLMSRNAEHNVLPATLIAWVIAAATALTIITWNS
jgi:hypothetical protein